MDKLPMPPHNTITKDPLLILGNDSIQKKTLEAEGNAMMHNNQHVVCDSLLMGHVESTFSHFTMSQAFSMK